MSTGIRREDVLRVALEIGQRCGAEALTMRRIADALGTSVTSLYVAFASKSALLLALQRQAIDRLTATLLRAFEIGDVRASMLAVSRGYLRFAVENPWLYGLLMGGPESGTPALGDAGQASAGDELVPQLLRARAIVERRYGEMLGHPLNRARSLAAWWAALHGFACMLSSRRIGPGHPVLPVEDLSLAIDEFTEHVVCGLVLVEPPSSSQPRAIAHQGEG